MFVPRTRGGTLASMIREKEYKLEELTGYRIKVVEKSGMMILRTLHQTNPWGDEDCEREDCLLCESKVGEDAQRKSCKKRNLVYETSCILCSQEGKVVRYLGETARSAYERGREHSKAYTNLALDSQMLKHKILYHREEEKEVKFTMKVLEFHQSSFDRQIHEAVAIEMAKERGEILCNSKGEYNRCVLPRLTALNGSSKNNESSDPLSEEEVEKLIQQMRKEARKRRRCKEEGEGERWKDTGGGEQTKPTKRLKLCKEGEARLKRSTRAPNFQPQPKRKKLQNRAELWTAQELQAGSMKTRAKLNRVQDQPQPKRKKIQKRAELWTAQKSTQAELNRKRCTERCDTHVEDRIPDLELSLSASHSVVTEVIVTHIETPRSQPTIESKASQKVTLSVSQPVQEKPGRKSTIVEFWKKREKKENEEARKKSPPKHAEKPNQFLSEEKPGNHKIKIFEKSSPKRKLKVKEIVNDFEEFFQPKENLKSEISFIENDQNSKQLFPIFLPSRIAQVQEKVAPSRSKKKERKFENKANPYGSIKDHLILLSTPQSEASKQINGTSFGIKKESENNWKHDPGPKDRTKISQDSI